MQAASAAVNAAAAPAATGSAAHTSPRIQNCPPMASAAGPATTATLAPSDRARGGPVSSADLCGFVHKITATVPAAAAAVHKPAATKSQTRTGVFRESQASGKLVT